MYFKFAVILSCLWNFSSASSFDKKSEVNTGLFWHITDIHVDQNYSRTGNPNNLCHQENVFYSDNGLYGNFLCDSPLYLVNSTVQAMHQIKPSPDFIIWTGDNLPHTVNFDPVWDVVFEAINNVTLLLKGYFPGIPVFPSIGNHDTFPPNVLLPNKSSKSIYQDYLTKGGWNKFLEEDSFTSFIAGGYYSQVFKPGLRIISLNTILWYTPNNFTEKMTDPADQFKWLTEVLNNCSKSSEKVYIIGHVPPGFYNRVKEGEKSIPTYHSQYLDAYLLVLKKYSKIIIGQMFGHLHLDMFQLFQLDSGHFLSSSLLASSVTPWHFESKDNVSIPVNPSIRLIHYDRANGLLKDYDQFYLNLTKANKFNKTQESSSYDLLYTFTESYDVPDISTESLVTVYENLKRNDTLFQKFFKFSTAGKESVACDLYCKIAQLCSIGSTSINEYNICMEKRSNSILNSQTYFAHQYSNYLVFGIIIVISCILIILPFIIYRRCNKSHSDVYFKLLQDF